MDTPVRSHHHLTLCVGGAQEDYDFHVKTLGLRNIKKTLLYDGKVPIYHLYYGNGVGAESTLITCFPMRQDGRVGRFGSGQVKTVMYPGAGILDPAAKSPRNTKLDAGAVRNQTTRFSSSV